MFVMHTKNTACTQDVVLYVTQNSELYGSKYTVYIVQSIRCPTAHRTLTTMGRRAVGIAKLYLSSGNDGFNHGISKVAIEHGTKMAFVVVSHTDWTYPMHHTNTS